MLFLLCNAGRVEPGVYWVVCSFDPCDYDEGFGYRGVPLKRQQPMTTPEALFVVTGMEAGHLRETPKNTPQP